MVDDGPPPASPLWRAWQGTSRADRVLAGAVVVVLLAVAGGVLVTGDDDEPVGSTTTAAASASPSPSASPPPSPSASASPSPSPVATSSSVPAAAPPPPPPSAEPTPSSAAPSPSATAAPASLQLDGDDLGVTRVGAPYADAVRALTAVLGPPVADPAPTTACVGAGDREVEWDGFRLAVTEGRVSGWSSSDGRLETPSGVGVGTTVTALREVYGDRLELYDASPDSAPGFAVAGVQLGGSLTGPGADDRVTGFHNRACSPP